jgi:hypothetical protein
LEDLTNIPSGNYDVTVTDKNGCKTIANATIDQPISTLSASAIVTDVLCFGNSTGSIDLTVSGGASSYQYNWSNGATTEDMSNLASGQYDVTIKDGNGCQETVITFINPPNTL